MPQSPRRLRLATLLVTAALGLAPGLAAAQTAQPFPSSIDTQTFWPGAGPSASTTLRSSDILPHLALGFGLLVNYAYRPLVVRDALRPDAGIVGGVDHLVTADFVWGLGFFNRAQLTLAVPIALAQFGQGLEPLGVPAPNASTQGLTATALRDLRFEASVQLLGRARTSTSNGFGLRAELGGAIPTGDERQLQGASTATFAPMVIADLRRSQVTVTLNLGARVREGAVLGSIAWASQFVLAGGVAWNPLAVRRLTMSLDVNSLLPLYAPWTVSYQGMQWGGSAPMTVEGTLGARVVLDRARDLELLVSVGVPFSSAATSPQVRGLVGISYMPRGLDDDGDGIINALDRCPAEPEDRDGFQDTDGCPDPDNDGDHVPDTADRCPNAPEDIDNFEDADGCPDPDNDADGVLDEADECTNEPAGPRPDPEHPGCPVRDRDGDSVPDGEDLCPDVARGTLPDPDRRGCPLPDQDHDGVADGADQCVNDPAGATPDRFRAGCPDPDRDHDGVPNEVDRCPAQPETVNGNQDDDGCPDEGDELTHWGGAAILFDNAPRLRAGLRTVPAALDSLLAQAAQRVRGHGGEVLRVHVEVVGAAGVPGQNEARRLAELVATALAAHGVERARIDAAPSPPPAPVVAPARPAARLPVGELRLRLELRPAPRR